METIHLMGAESVSSAGRVMKQAAESIERATNSIEESLERHRRWMDDWLGRLEAIFEAKGGG